MNALLLNIIIAVVCAVAGSLLTFNYLSRRMAVLHKVLNEISPVVHLDVWPSRDIEATATAAIELALFSGGKVQFKYGGFVTSVDMNTCPCCVVDEYKFWRNEQFGRLTIVDKNHG